MDSRRNGTIMKSLKEFALFPEGESVKDIWLLFKNRNHYDALITVDDPLIKIGTIEGR